MATKKPLQFNESEFITLLFEVRKDTHSMNNTGYSEYVRTLTDDIQRTQRLERIRK